MEYKKRSIRQEINATKGYEETYARMRMNTWEDISTDWEVRLNCLIQFVPGHTDRQIIERATIRL
jgi:hypothetical protein